MQRASQRLATWIEDAVYLIGISLPCTHSSLSLVCSCARCIFLKCTRTDVKVFTFFSFVRSFVSLSVYEVFQFSFLLLVSCCLRCLPIIFSFLLIVRLIPFVCYYHPDAYVTVCMSMSTVYRWKGAELCSPRQTYFGCIKCMKEMLVSNSFLESY